ncbi:MAG: NAD(+) synthase [Candidatus Handelsmanbacteria bacterium]|nr:NAD(+) synthase [Candidatus Handelsmanbacteria bacterium]
MNPSILPPIALVQMEVRPGRPDLNLACMLGFIEQARQSGAELVVFSELCLSGYLIGDLWEIDVLVEDYAAHSEEIRRASQGMVVLFGNVVVDPEQIGEDGRPRKYNAVCVCADGEYVARPDLPPGLPEGVQPKTLHPNYRFFDDDRHFYSLRKLAGAQGRPLYDWMVPFEVPIRAGGRFRFGVQLCEDIWCQDYSHEREVLDTLKIYHQRGAQAVFNLSASPWTWQKGDKRNRVVRQILKRSPLPFFYVNQVGAQNNGKNIIVFDGDTTAYAPQGGIAQRAQPWEEQMVLTRGTPQVAPAQGEVETVYRALLTGLRHLDHLRGGENKYLVALSGGIDSSVVACLLAKAFGPEQVYGVNMPTRFNAAVTQDNARHLSQALGIDYLSLSIEELYAQVADQIKAAQFARGSGNYTRLVDENIQARIRFGDILSGLAAKYGLLFTNNGNKTEVALGYCTLYGDVSGAVAPIADLYKVQVFALARYLNEEVFGAEVIPENILSGATVPSAELSEAQDVTKGMGDPIKYGYHDALLRQLIEYRHHPADVLQWFLDGALFERLGWRDEARFREYFPTPAAWVEDLEWVERQLRISYFKRIQAPPIIVLSKRAFGFDLRETQAPGYVPRRYTELKTQVLRMENWR